MPDTKETHDVYFYQLVLSLHTAAMQQMGKVMNPLTGEIERDISMAQQSIGMLEMIQQKTTGNLSEEEKKLVDHCLYELRMNYMDELKKGDTKPSDEDSSVGSEGEKVAEETESSKKTESPEKNEGPDEPSSDN